jgi:hypothetical protein
MLIARDVTADDLIVLRRYLKKRPAGARHRRYEYLSYLGFFTVIGFGALAIEFARWSATTPWLFALSPVIGAALCHPFWIYIDGRGDARLIAANALQLGRQEFWASDEGFGNKTPAGSTFHIWKAVASVENAPNLLFVDARTSFYSIPRREGPDGELDEFVAVVRQKWLSADEHAVDQRVEADDGRERTSHR